MKQEAAVFFNVWNKHLLWSNEPFSSLDDNKPHVTLTVVVWPAGSCYQHLAISITSNHYSTYCWHLPFIHYPISIPSIPILQVEKLTSISPGILLCRNIFILKKTKRSLVLFFLHALLFCSLT